MTTTRMILRSLPWIIIAILFLPGGIGAQDNGYEDDYVPFRKEELTQMLAAIALYPDPLVAQILMASTYPLELVEADQWLKRNRGLKGDPLDKALLEKSWDPSVKSLCHFPDLLDSLSSKLDQTRKLGDAFLNQEDDVMATIQELRRMAEDQGNLKTSREQKVIDEDEIITIEPADPDVVYVPVYDPLYIYGPWWYADYPPYYWYYPPGFVISGGYMGFGLRIFFGFGLFSWCRFDWHTHRIHVNYDNTRRFDRRRPRNITYWSHDPRHRRGVAYRDIRTSEHFGARPRIAPKRPDIRGYPPRELERKTPLPQTPVERREGAIAPPLTERPKIRSAPRFDTPFRGIGEGGFERKAGERGVESLKSREAISPAREIRQRGEGARRQGGELGRRGGDSIPQGRRGAVRGSPPSSLRGGGPRR
jgi:hypothetical protein